ncbi:MAG: DUF3465 domain-containing protein [Rhodothermales bacterium]
MKRRSPLTIVLALLCIGLGLWYEYGRGTVATETPAGTIETAFAEQARDLPVEGEGVVLRILSDDNDGSRHQRFVLELASGHTVLVAHNIDLAPRLEGIARGERVRFKGEYAWNPEGGVVHWTHHDPQGRHAGGWLEYRGTRFE